MKQYNMYNKKNNNINGERHYSSIIVKKYSIVKYNTNIQRRNFSCDPFSIIFTFFSVIALGKVGQLSLNHYTKNLFISDKIERLS